MEERIELSKKYNESKPLKLKGRQLILIGFGSVGRPFLYKLMIWSTINHSDIVVVDKQDLSQFIPTGIKFIQREVKRDNYLRTLKHLKKGDLIIDLSLYVDTIKLIKFCMKVGCHLITSSIEAWDLYKERKERTLISSFKDVSVFQRRCEKKGCPTVVLNHGANPGMVSHFIRMAIDKIQPLKKDEKWNRESYAKRAKKMKLRTIHISEIDTQVEHEPEKDKWRNTWSINGFFEEGTAPPELGYGSHERSLEGGEVIRVKSKAKVAILPSIGWKTMVRSYVPEQSFTGYLVQHAESITIHSFLKTGSYAPSVYYAYKPCKGSIESIEKFGVKRDPEPKIQKILNHTNASGEDRLGTLLLTDSFSWWCGSITNSTETKKIFDGYEFAGPTSSQVVAGVLGAIQLILDKPALGILEPDDIPVSYTPKMIKFVAPLLGEIYNERVSWTGRPGTDLTKLMKK